MRRKSSIKYPPTAPGPKKRWREEFLHSLPHYPGPYNVGYMEVEVPARSPRAFSHIRRNHEPALRMDTVLFSVFYPCEQAPADEPSLDTVPWLPRPRTESAHGYARFLQVPSWPVTAYLAGTSMFTKLPAFRNARLAVGWVAENSGGGEKGEKGEGRRRDDPQSREDGERPRFPVMMFSHGLGGSRTLASSICGGLASYGVVVVAMEHRDGSGARTFVNLPPGKEAHRDLDDEEVDKDRQHTKAEEKQDKKEKRKEKRRQKEGKSSRKPPAKSYYEVDYLWPEGNAMDTSPNNPQGVDVELREAQIEMRVGEIEEAYHVLTMINDGRGGEVREVNQRKKGTVGSSSKGLEGIDWQDWKGRLHLENVTMAGHSFGGATSVQVIRLGDRFPWIGQGVLLDAWGPGVPENTGQRIRKPILSIGSEAFMHWQENFDRVENICREGLDQGVLCWQMTIRGSTHLSQTDFAVLYPNWMALLAKTLVNPRRALFLTVTMILEFLQYTLPAEHRTRLETAWPNEHILETPSSDTKITFDHRPDDKWIAARLKIESEFSLRLSYWVRWRRRWRARRQARRAVPITSAAGAPLGGLITWDSEIWMHLRPEIDSSSAPSSKTVTREGEPMSKTASSASVPITSSRT
ncbi:platelet-activating factor acetylhydrolase [Coniochaeta sp. 2T2.1]|nr:platelet-activating factor acetylhydrolase [Coniochaeta sp. 2T2.1]